MRRKSSNGHDASTHLSGSINHDDNHKVVSVILLEDINNLYSCDRLAKGTNVYWATLAQFVVKQLIATIKSLVIYRPKHLPNTCMEHEKSVTRECNSRVWQQIVRCLLARGPHCRPMRITAWYVSGFLVTKSPTAYKYPWNPPRPINQPDITYRSHRSFWFRIEWNQPDCGLIWLMRTRKLWVPSPTQIGHQPFELTARGGKRGNTHWSL